MTADVRPSLEDAFAELYAAAKEYVREYETAVAKSDTQDPLGFGTVKAACQLRMAAGGMDALSQTIGRGLQGHDSANH